MLLGTRNVSESFVALTSCTAENQRLNVSALTCGLRAADTFCHSCEHFSSMPNLLTGLSDGNVTRIGSDFALRNEASDDEQSTTASGADAGKNSVNFAKYEGKIESVGEGTLSSVACFAVENPGMIGKASVMIIFLRKSFSELSTSY